MWATFLLAEIFVDLLPDTGVRRCLGGFLSEQIKYVKQLFEITARNCYTILRELRKRWPTILSCVVI